MSRDVRTPSEQEPHRTEHARTKRKASILGYLSILFAVAFLLLLMAYFQQQRANSETTDALKQSVSTWQSVHQLLDENATLQEENSTLRDELDALRSQVTELDSARRIQNLNLEQMSDQLVAMDYLWRIQRFYSRGAYDDARALTDKFEATDLPAALPRENLSGASGASPMDQYNALLDAMDYRDEP